MSKTKDTEIRKLKISVSNIEDAVASFLIATGVVNDDEDIIEVTLPIKTTKDGIVNTSITVLKMNAKK